MATHAASIVSMSTVMRDISEALSLDRSNKKEEAYRKYLECVLRITTKLLKDLHAEGGHVTFNKEVSRFVKLGQQCMERMASIATEQTGPGPPQVPNSLRITASDPLGRLQSPPTPGAEIIASPRSLSTTTATDSQARGKKMSPMELAVRHNQQLLAAYRARQAGKNKSLSASQNLALTIQRKMTENLAIAKAREEALAKKMRERQKRLEEQAARRFHTPLGLSEEEQHQRQIYTKILEFEQEEVYRKAIQDPKKIHTNSEGFDQTQWMIRAFAGCIGHIIWMIDLRKQLEASPDDVLVIYTLIDKVLSSDNHPLTQQLRIYQDKTLQQIYPLVQGKTDQINQVMVPVPKHLLANLRKIHKDQLNSASKQIVYSDTVDKTVVKSKKSKAGKDKQDQTVNDTNTQKEEAGKIPVEKCEENEEEDGHEDKMVNIPLKERGKGSSKEECEKEIKENEEEDEVDNSDFKEELTENETVKVDGKLKDINDQAITKNEGLECESFSATDENLESGSEIDFEASVIFHNNETEIRPVGKEIEEDIEPAAEDISEEDKGNRKGKTASLGNDMDNITKNIKQDLETAIVKGQRLRDQLEEENRSLKSLSRGLSLEYEKYNEENMDDLFDDDDDENEETDSALGSSLYSLASGGESQGGENERFFDKAQILTGGPKVKEDKQNLVKSKSHVDNRKFGEVIDTKESETETVYLEEENANKKNCLPKNLSFRNLEGAIKQLRNEAYHRHLKNITEEILTSIEKIQVLFVIGFEQLDTAEGRDQCNVLVEKHFFKPIWKYLLMLFRLANEPKEIAMAHMMTVNQGKGPEEFSVREKLCLSSGNNNDSEDYPYAAAVVELCRVQEKPTMLDKLECLVKTSRLVLTCVDQYYEETNKDISEKPSIGADDLLPVLCYIVARSRMPEIVSECQAMERFIHEGYMYGEEGYCLTSFQTAINYLISEGIKAAVNDDT